MVKCFCRAGLEESLGQPDLPVVCPICGGDGEVASHLDLLDVGQMPEGEEDESESQ